MRINSCNTMAYVWAWGCAGVGVFCGAANGWGRVGLRQTRFFRQSSLQNKFLFVRCGFGNVRFMASAATPHTAQIRRGKIVHK